MSVASIIRAKKGEIMDRWEALVRALPSVDTAQPSPDLRNNIPGILERLASWLESGAREDEADVLRAATRKHAEYRLRQGTSLDTVLHEYRLLRRVLHQIVTETTHVTPDDLQTVQESLDFALTQTASYYAGRREEALEESREVLQRVIDQSADGIIIADERGVIRVFNRAAEEQHGVTKAEVAPPEWQSTYGLLDMSGRPLAMEETPLWRALQGEAVPGARFKVRQPGGTIRVLRGSASPLRRPDGSPAGALLVSSDETEREELLDRLGQEVERRRKLDETRELFIDVLAHDLRSPLSVIVMGSATLEQVLSDQDAAIRVVNRISRSAGRMEELIQGLLAYARARLGRESFPLRKVEADAASVAGDVFSEIQSAHPGRDLRFEHEGDLKGTFDPDRVAQVIMNLVANGIKHGDDPVVLWVGSDGSDLLVSVTNAGPPISPEMQELIFEPYRQAGGKAPSGAGLGLGLFVAREIAHAHGGDLTVRSDSETGTTFTMRLPRGG